MIASLAAHHPSVEDAWSCRGVAQALLLEHDREHHCVFFFGDYLVIPDS